MEIGNTYIAPNDYIFTITEIIDDNLVRIDFKSNFGDEGNMIKSKFIIEKWIAVSTITKETERRNKLKRILDVT